MLRWWVTLLTPFFFAGLLAEAVLLSEVPFASVTSGLVSKNNANATVESVGNPLRGERLGSLRADVALACVMGDFQCGSEVQVLRECSRLHGAWQG